MGKKSDDKKDDGKKDDGKKDDGKKADGLPRMPPFNPDAPATGEFPPGRGPYKPTF